MRYPFKFDVDKGIETILYILENGAQPTIFHILKIMYFADKQHLQNFGRFIFGDRYIAMKDGPVPSFIYDLLKCSRGDQFLNAEIEQKSNNAFKVENHYTVSPLRKADKEIFSESEIHCLDDSIKNNGNLSFGQLREKSHDAAWKAADLNNCIEIDYIVETFANSQELREHLLDPYPGAAA